MYVYTVCICVLVRKLGSQLHHSHMKSKSVCVVASLLIAVCVAQRELCPPWFIYDSNTTIYSSSFKQYSHCVCGEALPLEIQCNIEDYTTFLLSGNCAFWSNTTGRTVVGYCPYVIPEQLLAGRMIKLPQDVLKLNSFLCGNLNRETGTSVCGRCVNGTGPSVTSLGSECTQCSPVNVLYYILLHYLPATIIFLLVLIVQVDITSTPIAYYILYSNAMVVDLRTPGGFSVYLGLSGKEYKYTLRAILTVHSILSFDPLYFISPPLCISPHLKDIHIPYIEMVKTLYPFILLLLAYIGIELHARDFKPIVFLWRPMYRKFIRLRSNWNPHVSLVQSFATIFFISYLKILCLIATPFNLTDFVDDHGEYVAHSKTMYIDPQVPFGHPQQIYLIIFSLAILIFIVLPPIVILLIYPTRLFDKLQEHLSPRVNLALKIFVTTYQGCYKDGTNGTRDYRSFPGVILVFFVVLMALQHGLTSLEISNKKPLIIWQLNTVLLICCTALFAVFRPHKSETANNIAICLCTILTIQAATETFVATYFVANILADFVVVAICTIPDFVFYGYLIHRAATKFKGAIRRCCRVVRSTEMEQRAILNHD